jgi:hypothetical protein
MAELAAALWSLANGLLHYGRDLLRVAIPLPHPVTDAAALHLVLWLTTALAVLPWRWSAIEAAGTADADQLRRLEWAAAKWAAAKDSVGHVLIGELDETRGVVVNLAERLLQVGLEVGRQPAEEPVHAAFPLVVHARRD